MRSLFLSAILLSACVTPSAGPNSPDSAAGSSATEASAPSAAGAGTAAVSTGPKRIVGYFTNWASSRKGGCAYTAANVKPELLTHINFSFAKVDPGPGGKA